MIIQLNFEAFISFILLIVTCWSTVLCSNDYCYTLDLKRPHAAHFGKITSYSVVKGPESGEQFKNSSKI